MQAPMISTPLKQTNEIDWITPLKNYIRQTYGDDPERYSEECATLNRLRQDMRGAGKDSAAGRDLLYRYYGQLELLDLRFPVDENHIKISFTWFDAFTHKPTSQYSLAYEKASIIFNISAVLSCHAAHQNRHEETGLKTAYHSFQASAGMFTYINENFLHAPSTDLNHDTVRTLISVMLAQAQEVFLEKQIADGKKPGLLAKLASQAAFLFSQAVEGVTENVSKAVFEKVWLLLTQIKAFHMASLAQYYQAISDAEVSKHGDAICRLQSAERQAKDGSRMANSFPGSLPANSNLGSDTGPALMDINKRHIATVQEKLAEYIKDNDFIYHQPVPSEASLTAIPKLPAAKAISVSELYQGQDMHRIIGPDIFQRIVPMSVTEQASLYDEEKAKLIRAESERAEIANDEMAASLDYLKLPNSLNVLKGGLDQEMTVDEEFRGWCEELSGHAPFKDAFDRLSVQKSTITNLLDESTKKLGMEESVCEKMRSKYGADWTQSPSSHLTSTLRNDIKNYRSTIDKASTSDATLFSTFRLNELEFDEMRSAGEADEADVLYQRAMIKAGAARKGKSGTTLANSPGDNLIDEDFGESEFSVANQIGTVEELLRKLNLIKRERGQVLKDLKEKVHNDDISQILILNKKNISNQESQLFKAELEKFRPYQNRLLQANHKQASVMKELTRVYNDLLQDKRVRSEQSKYESFSRQRSTVMTKYQRLIQTFHDLASGLIKAQTFYAEMQGAVDSLVQNVDEFVSNRKSEGGRLLQQIENLKANGSNELADRDRERLKELMERASLEDSQASTKHRPDALQNIPTYQPAYNPAASPPISSTYASNPRSPPITASLVTPRTMQHQQPMNSPNYMQHHQSRQHMSQQQNHSQVHHQPLTGPLNGSFSSASFQANHPRRGSSTSSASYIPTHYPHSYHLPISPPPQQMQQSFPVQNLQQGQISSPSNQYPQNYSSPRQYPQPTQPQHSTQMQAQSHSSYVQNQQVQQPQSQDSEPLPPGFVPPPPPPGRPPNSSSPHADPWAGLGAWK